MATEPVISGHTHLITLIGKPTDHSMSPAIHTYSFARCGVNAVYLAFDNELQAIPDILNAMRQSNGWDGANATMPYKQAVVEHLDGLSEAARIMGAVSVIVKDQDGKLIGHNADGAGFMDNLRNHGVQVEGATMTLLGPGGAGGAILVQAALDGVKKLNVFAREGGKSYQRAQGLIEKTVAATGCDITLHAIEDLDDLKACIAERTSLATPPTSAWAKGARTPPFPPSSCAATWSWQMRFTCPSARSSCKMPRRPALRQLPASVCSSSRVRSANASGTASKCPSMRSSRSSSPKPTKPCDYKRNASEHVHDALRPHVTCGGSFGSGGYAASAQDGVGSGVGMGTLRARLSARIGRCRAIQG